MTQKLEEQTANYNQLLSLLKDERSKMEKLAAENERFGNLLKQK